MTPPDELHPDEHGGEGEWISNEPPVDDFGDPAAESGATVSEGDEHAHEEAAAEDQPVEEKKKFPLLLLVGAVGSLAVVGGLAYWQFGGHREEPSLLDMAAQNNNAPAAAAPHFAAKPPQTAEAPAVPNYAAKPVAASSPQASPAPQALDVAPTTSYSQPSMMGEAVKKVSLQEAGAAMPSAPASSPQPPANAGIALDKEPPSAPAAPLAPAASDTKLAALSVRIDDLQKSLSQATVQLGQISDKLGTIQNVQPASPAAASAQPDAATEERINKLEQKLAQLEQQHQPAPALQVGTVDNVFPSQASRKPKHHVTHKAASHKMGHQTPKPAASKEKWVLRAATPDEAWVAKNMETRELRPVHVGDNLAGIGKVTAIRQVGEAWVLEGSSGTIR